MRGVLRSSDTRLENTRDMRDMSEEYSIARKQDRSKTSNQEIFLKRAPREASHHSPWGFQSELDFQKSNTSTQGIKSMLRLAWKLSLWISVSERPVYYHPFRRGQYSDTHGQANALAA